MSVCSHFHLQHTLKNNIIIKQTQEVKWNVQEKYCTHTHLDKEIQKRPRRKVKLS